MRTRDAPYEHSEKEQKEHQHGNSSGDVSVPHEKGLLAAEPDLGIEHGRLPPVGSGDDLPGRIDHGRDSGVGATGNPTPRLDGSEG